MYMQFQVVQTSLIEQISFNYKTWNAYVYGNSRKLCKNSVIFICPMEQINLFVDGKSVSIRKHEMFDLIVCDSSKLFQIQ